MSAHTAKKTPIPKNVLETAMEWEKSLLFLANPDLIVATQHEDQITVPRAEETSYATKTTLTWLDLQIDMKFNLGFPFKCLW